MVGATAGDIVTTTGKVVGQHNGFEAFTVGQRKGLGVAMGTPHFVVRIEPDTSNVVIGPLDSMNRSDLVANDANWLIDVEEMPAQVSVQIRYNGSPKPGRVTIDADDPSQFSVVFDEPQFAVAPGQAAVVYDNTRVLGGGWIQ